MRLTILKDKKITDEDINELERQFADIYFENTGMTPVFFVEERDYTSYPMVTDADGDRKLTDAYMKEACADVSKRYSGEGTDHVVFMIHEDNWKLRGIWGVNYSNRYNGYQVEVCRFDRDNIANSLGTIYHEVMHSHDAIIKTYTGVDIHKLFGYNWDAGVVHGKTEPWDYIRWKENQKALQKIAPYLVKAYQERLALYNKKKGLLNQVVHLAKKVLFLSRMILNKKKKY